MSTNIVFHLFFIFSTLCECLNIHGHVVDEYFFNTPSSSSTQHQHNLDIDMFIKKQIRLRCSTPKVAHTITISFLIFYTRPQYLGGCQVPQQRKIPPPPKIFHVQK